MNRGKEEYSFMWLIQNYSCCWHKNGQLLISPTLVADRLNDTYWFLRVDPRGTREEDEGYISLFLHRSTFDEGPENFDLKYELSILAADGSALRSQEFEYTFRKGMGYGFSQFLQMDEVLCRRKADYLPKDTLSVCCRMWKGEGSLQQVTQIKGRTRIEIEQISFLQVIEGFSALKTCQNETVEIPQHGKEKCPLSSSLYVTDDCDGILKVKITSPIKKHILFQCKISLLDASGIFVKCGEADNRSHTTEPDIHRLRLSLTRKAILNRKSKYLPDDKLTLLFECDFSTGEKFDVVERVLHELPPSVTLNQIFNNDQNENTCNGAEKSCVSPSPLVDFKSLFNNAYIDLKTKGTSPSTHNPVLGAKSPVFEVKLPDDMEEKISYCGLNYYSFDVIVQKFVTYTLFMFIVISFLEALPLLRAFINRK